jgi:hypothetical protein
MGPNFDADLITKKSQLAAYFQNVVLMMNEPPAFLERMLFILFF